VQQSVIVQFDYLVAFTRPVLQIDELYVPTQRIIPACDLARLSGEPGLFLLTLVAADGEGAYVQYWAHLARLSLPIGTMTFSSGARTRRGKKILEGRRSAMDTRDSILALPTLVGVLAFLPMATAQVPNSIAAPGEAVVLKVHAEGAQVYECKASPDAKLVWQFREPIATLIADGNTVGRHYAGPNWELADGSAIVGKVVGDAPGADANDIPWLKLNVVAQRGNGTLTGVTTVQRINTKGGKLNGTCDQAGKLRAAQYAADYVFLRKN
jgi:hypothetical protein